MVPGNVPRAMPVLTHKHVRLHRSPEDGERLHGQPLLPACPGRVPYPRGSARPRVAMMLRWISEVPPPMVEATALR